jgi:hypothetical protein
LVEEGAREVPEAEAAMAALVVKAALELVVAIAT